ncbi:gasdermin-D [Phascolarctos cinereus]|uniref:Gasdermin-D n=1 Tax=Phascolarctos cinereus TaxID=38626 RepID=A0A6P5KX81_PHACI|nr:gasdermin-D [Phascolarctos cinereus]XP_020850600.1 gasdermin-D [Phascolarctos cinereus]
MASAFEWAAKNVVRELSKNGELVPVDSLKSSTHFNPYYLVRKKARSSLFWRSQYVWLNLTLKDILDPSSPEPEVTQHGPFHFNDEVDGMMSGSVEVTASVQGKISGHTSVSNKTVLEVKTLIVSPNTWDSLQKERTLKTPEPYIIQELRKRGENLYVVTEAVKTQKEAILKRSRNRKGFGKIIIPGASCVQGEGQGSLNTVKTVTVPEGSILAFQVAKLIIQDHWKVLPFPDKDQKTFSPKKIVSGMYQSDSCGRTIVSTVLDFNQLQAEVKNEQNLLTMLDRKLRQFLLQPLLGLLQSEQDLLDLENMLEQSLYTGVPPQKAKGMTGDILSNLQDQNGQLVEELAGAFLYLLGALNALSDIQHQLLIQLLQKKEPILSQEAELVKAILKENFNQTKKRPFSLPSELLSFVRGQDEDSILTCGLLEECGLWLSGDEPQFTWHPSAVHSLCALYGSLVMLQALTEA